MNVDTISSLSDSEIDDEILERYAQIPEQIYDALVVAGVPHKDLGKMVKKLEKYQYVPMLDDLVEGQYIRWIKYGKDDTISLAKGAILNYVTTDDTNKEMLLCKTPFNRYFSIDVPRGPIFQKLTDTDFELARAIQFIEEN